MTRRPTPYLRPTLLAAALCVAFAAQGQDRPEPAKPDPKPGTSAGTGDTVLPAVKVQAARERYRAGEPASAKLDAPARDIPQAINVVPRQLLEDQSARSMQDALRNVPGVGFSNGDGQRDQVTIRGFTAIGDQFLDGIRDDGLYFRDLASTEQVEVLKGPSSVLYGRGSSGGLINRITKKPHAKDSAEATLRVGSFGFKRVEGDLNRGGEQAQFRLVAALEDSEGFRQQGFIERHLVAPSLAWKLSPDTRLLFQVEVLKDKRVTDFGIPAVNGRPADVPVENYYGSNDARCDDYTQSDVNTGTVTLDHRLGGGASIKSVLRAYTYKLDRNNTTVTAVSSAANPVLSRRHGVVRRDEKGVFNQTDWTLSGEAFGLKHQWLVGAELGRQHKDGKFGNVSGTIPTVTLYDPVLTAMPTSPVVNTTDNTGTSTVIAGYVQDLVDFGSGWKALLGLRYDSFEQEADDHLTNTRYGRTDREFSPRLGVVWQPSAWLSLYAAATRSFQPSQESFTAAANAIGIEPERTRNLEVGAKADTLDGALSATLAVFDLQRSGIKTVDPADATKLIPIGTQRTRGVELSVIGRPAAGWELAGGYAYLDGRITKSTARVSGVLVEGHRSALTPVHSASLWLTHRLGNGFGLGGGLVYMGDRYASPSNLVTLPAYTRADLAAFYESRGFDLRLALNNVSNKRYFESAHGGADNYNTPGAPRNFEASLRLKF